MLRYLLILDVALVATFLAVLYARPRGLSSTIYAILVLLRSYITIARSVYLSPNLTLPVDNENRPRTAVSRDLYSRDCLVATIPIYPSLPGHIIIDSLGNPLRSTRPLFCAKLAMDA